MNDENDLITATSASSPIEAEIMKSKLESAGIRSFIADKNAISINPLYNNALGGVRVQVRKADFSKARQILQLDNQQTPEKAACPQCSGTKLHYDKLPGLLNLAAFLGLGVFFLKLRRRWTCEKCRYTWRS